MIMKDFIVLASNIRDAFTTTVKDFVALFLGTIIATMMIILFAYASQAEWSADDKAFLYILLVFVPVIVFALILMFNSRKNEKEFSQGCRISLIPALTGFTLFVSWLVIGSITYMLDDESYVAVIILTILVTIIALGLNLVIPPYVAGVICIMCAVVSLVAYVWAGIFYNPCEVTGTSTDPEAILHFKTNFVFSWGWEVLLAICSSLIAMLPLRLRK